MYRGQIDLHMKNNSIIIFVVILLGVVVFGFRHGNTILGVRKSYQYVGRQFAAIFFRESVTVAALKSKYAVAPQKKIRILIVPGHEPDFPTRLA